MILPSLRHWRGLIPVPSRVVVWLAVGHTDMLRGMNSLALTVQEVLKRDPQAGDLYVFRGRTRKAPRRDLPLRLNDAAVSSTTPQGQLSKH